MPQKLSESELVILKVFYDWIMTGRNRVAHPWYTAGQECAAGHLDPVEAVPECLLLAELEDRYPDAERIIRRLRLKGLITYSRRAYLTLGSWRLSDGRLYHLNYVKKGNRLLLSIDGVQYYSTFRPGRSRPGRWYTIAPEGIAQVERKVLPQRKRRGLNKQQVGMALSLAAEGIGPSEIAQRIGCNRHQLYSNSQFRGGQERLSELKEQRRPHRGFKDSENGGLEAYQ